MKILIVVGHSKLKSGGYTSASGVVNEYLWNKRFSKNLKAALKKKGHTVSILRCPSSKFTSASQERTYKLDYLKNKHYDLIIELHCNATTNKLAKGCEALYISPAGKAYANMLLKGLSKDFVNRGVKKRTDLYMLTKTKDPTVMLESFFCTSEEDCAKAKGYKNRKRIARNIASAF